MRSAGVSKTAEDNSKDKCRGGRTLNDLVGVYVVSGYGYIYNNGFDHPCNGSTLTSAIIQNDSEIGERGKSGLQQRQSQATFGAGKGCAFTAV